jgi:hypothetical protein
MAAVQQERIGTGLERLPFIGHSRKGYGVTKGRAGYVLRTWGLAGAGLRLQEGGSAAASRCEAEGFDYGLR